MYKLVVSKYGLVSRTITGKTPVLSCLVKSLVYGIANKRKTGRKRPFD